MDKTKQLSEHTEVIHPAIDFKGDSIIVGFKLRTIQKDKILNTPIYIVKDNDKLSIKEHTTQIKLSGKDYVVDNTSGLPFVNDRWLYDNINKFLSEPKYDADLFNKLKQSIQQHIYFNNNTYTDLMVLWIIGTYFVHMFSAYPYLFFYGSKETGKSNTLNVIVNLSFNGNKLVRITESAIGNYTTFKRGTLCIDQVENIKSDLVNLIADGYKKNGGNRQVMKGKDIYEFSTFGAKAFASFKPLPYDLSDRCIQFYTVKASTAGVTVNDFTGNESIWGKLRDKIYRFLLMKFKDVKKYYEELSSEGSRKGELWRPLHAIAKALELPKIEIDLIHTTFNTCMTKPSNVLTPMEQALLMVLNKKCNDNPNGDTFEISALEIRNLMSAYLQDKTISCQWIGQQIKWFDLLREDEEDEGYGKGEKKTKTRLKLVYYTLYTEDINKIVNEHYPYIKELSEKLKT
jgi:hypothetical protein